MRKFRVEFLPSVRNLNRRNAAALDRADEREEKGSIQPHFLEDKAPRNVLAGTKFKGTDSNGCRFREVIATEHPELHEAVVRLFADRMELPTGFRIFEAKRPALRRQTNFPAPGSHIIVQGAKYHKPNPKRRIGYLKDLLVIVDTILPVHRVSRKRCWVLAVPG